MLFELTFCLNITGIKNNVKGPGPEPQSGAGVPKLKANNFGSDRNTAHKNSYSMFQLTCRAAGMVMIFWMVPLNRSM